MFQVNSQQLWFDGGINIWRRRPKILMFAKVGELKLLKWYLRYYFQHIMKYKGSIL